MSKEAVLFVFYQPGDQSSRSWPWGKLPEGWWWVGSGGTSNSDYPLEMQFQGPKKFSKKTRERLTKMFQKFKKQGLVKKFKIRASYKP